MGLDHGWRGPNIVRDGLVLYLDAGSPNSYQGSGTTWKDISKFYQNNGTLTNGPTFNSANGGSIVFDGVDDKVVIPSIFTGNPNFSVEFWFFVTATGTPVMLGNSSSGLAFLTYADLGPARNFRVGVWGNDYLVLINGILSSSTWYCITLTHDQITTKGYVNGIFDNSAPRTLNISSVGTFIGAANSIQYFTGRISLCRLYNRALSASEVFQNYNATKGRFGL